jgi:hypothetical protein
MKASTLAAVELLECSTEGVTRMTALLAGVGNLPARVLEAKACGYVIRDEWEETPNGARIKRWFLVRGPRPSATTGTQIGAFA